MAKQVNAGDLRTRVRFYKVTKGVNENGFAVQTTTDIFEKPVYCHWQWRHGTEVYEHDKHQLGQEATLTMYASPKVDVECRVELVDEQALVGTNGGPFEIVSMDSVENRRRFMEIRVRRRVKA